MSDHSEWKFRIRHIHEAIEQIQDFVRDMDFDGFMDDTKTRKAVERNVEIIGEAAGKLPQHVRERYNDIPWSAIKGMRNVIIHGYDGIEYESVWDVVNDRLPILKEQIKSILQNMDKPD